MEQIIEPDPSRGRSTDYLVDMQMMAMFGSAGARTEEEFRGLLAKKAGLLLRKRIATKSPVSILEATRLNLQVPQQSLYAH